MGSFNNNAITDAGRLLLGDVQMGATFQPTKIVLGSGRMPAGAIVQDMKAVVAPVIELGINKKKKANDGTVIIGGVYNNESIKEDFYFRELALFAKAIRPDGSEVAEVLYSYGNAGESADLMPAYTTGTAVERQIDLATYIGNDAKVDVTVESGLFIPMSDKGNPDGVATLGADGKVPEEQLPQLDFIPLSEKGRPNGVATLGEDGKVSPDQLEKNFDQLADKYGFTYTETDDGVVTHTETVKDTCPVKAQRVTVEGEDALGNDTFTITITIDKQVVTQTITVGETTAEMVVS